MTEEASSEARFRWKSFLDQKIHSGLTAEGGLDTVYRTIFTVKKGVNDETMGQFSLLEKDEVSRSVVIARLIAEDKKKK